MGFLALGMGSPPWPGVFVKGEHVYSLRCESIIPWRKSGRVAMVQ